MSGVLARRPCAAPPFVGRERELRLLTGLARAGRSGGGAAVVHGEAGVGKTALLTRLAEVSPGRTLWARGFEEEATVPFVALNDLLLPLHDRFGELPPVQREALDVSLALGEGPPVAPLAVCSAALTVLAAAAEREPLLLLVDDLQWVDAASRQVLLFAARRLGADRVVVFFAVRDRPPLPDPTFGLPAVRLGGLPPDACRALVAAHGMAVPDHVLAALTEQAGGNPLALLESVGEVPDAAGPDADLPAGRSARRGWADVVDRLPEATRTALYAVAAGRTGAAAGLEPVLAEVGGSLADLAPAEREGLLHAPDGVLDLRHPVLRAVLLDRTPLGVRVRVHRAFAGHCAGPERAWHLAAAALGPDEEVAGRLVAAAASARSGGGYGFAARVLGRAAALSPAPAARAARLLAAATDALVAGQAAQATGFCVEAVALQPDAAFRADVALVAGRAASAAGHPRRALDELVRAAGAVQELDPRRAAALLAEAVHPAAVTGRIGRAAELAARAELLAATAGGPTLPVLAASATALVLSGRVAAGRVRAALRRAADAAEDCEPALALARAAMWSEDREPAFTCAGTVLDEARRRGAAGTIGPALALRAELEWWSGHWAAADADATEAARWGTELDQPGVTAAAEMIRARLDACRGDLAACRERVSRVTRDHGSRGTTVTTLQRPAVLGLAALGAGELPEAIEELEAAFGAAADAGLAVTTAVPFAGDLAEAHVRAGNAARAAEILSGLDAAAAAGLAYPAAAAARCRGLAAGDPDTAREHFVEAARRHGREAAPFELARTRLAEGEALRRLRRPAAARPALRAALTAFDGLGARPWAARAEAELEATGPHRVARPADPSGLDGLTAQEYQIACIVADGLNNVEAAAVLYLSRKTVEAHLTRVYRKLGLRSRTDLARMFGQLRPDGGPRRR